MIIPVTCAIILLERKVLATQRSESMNLPGFWEFPGGKVESGESPEDCLHREIKEELNIEIDLLDRWNSFEHSYQPGKIIQLIPFLVSFKGGELILSEHTAYRWLGLSELFEVNWAQADIPIVQELSRKWGSIQKNY
ncbi:(deoxy)nucleoside triphosphate pyrophosphohydrolase [Algoriphagus algorifonticola]|uniref:(deoxy)nucleoside triphosphate pyrophosphohydrolase n=1 Tax=Algoriphagus algorifonticola TaxID=2593007 RepID=UPI00119D8DBC|nr:(deoxy)nucleoside triphosphate pyrophosphohydrolase [Algoriphagus algorifonticola]